MFQLSRSSRVGIIGAGPAGLSSAVQLRLAGFNNFKVFEKSAALGGTWRYSDNPHDDRSSSMYKNLRYDLIMSHTYNYESFNSRTNLPKECMSFPNFNFHHLPTSFPSHAEVLKYLDTYANYHNLRNYIEFENSVKSVEKSRENLKKWKIETERGESGEFDFVIVANGHYSKPYLPDLFNNSPFQGQIIHSHVYRRPQVYNDKDVLGLLSSPV